MKSLFYSALFLLTFSQNAQSPTAVPVKDEPHHHLVLENSYVRVFRVSIPANDATLLHQHDLPYLFVALGPADFTNAVAGKPEVEAKLVDGQVGYSRGGFAHIARTDHDLPFNNVTVELLHPQGEPRNLCEKVIDGPVNDCSSKGSSNVPADSPLRALAKAAISPRNVFQTEEILVQSYSNSLKSTFTEPSKTPKLLIVGNAADLRVERAGESPKSLHAGEVMWLEGGQKWTMSLPGEGKVTNFLLVQFRGIDSGAKP